MADTLHAPLLIQQPNQARSASDCKLKGINSCFLKEGATQKQAQASARVQNKLIAALVLSIIFMVVEVIGGYLAGSVAILSDAAHMLSDVIGLLVSIFATWAVTRRSHGSYTFGYHRVEILGALLSILVIWGVTGALVWEAVQRITNPEVVDGKLMFIIASAGIVFNLVVGTVLGHGHIGHSHGPGGCGHDHGDHGHDHGDHHGHDHGHSHGHSHEAHGSGGHSHSHAPPPAGPADVEQGHAPHKHSDHAHSDHADHGHGSGGCKGHSHAAHDHSAHAHSDHDHSDHEHSDHDHSDHNHGPGGCKGHSHAAHDHSAHGHAHSDHAAHSHSPGECDHGHDHSHDHGSKAGSASRDRDNMNLRSAMIHVLGDLVQSAGVALSGLLIWMNKDDPRWQIADPICTFVFAAIVLFTTVGIVRDVTHTLMERAPLHVDMEEVLDALHQIEGVLDVHDLHVWNISSGVEPIFTAHVHISVGASSDCVLKRLEEYVRGMGITHSTIQICNS